MLFSEKNYPVNYCLQEFQKKQGHCKVKLVDTLERNAIMTLEQKLRDSRIGCGLSQEDLAGKVNVSRQTVSGWERGTVRPSADNLAALSEIFQIPVDALLKEDWVPPEEKGPAVQIVEVPVPRSIRWRLLVLAGYPDCWYRNRRPAVPRTARKSCSIFTIRNGDDRPKSRKYYH